jgi:hypothetical protein
VNHINLLPLFLYAALDDLTKEREALQEALSQKPLDPLHAQYWEALMAIKELIKARET